MVAGVSGFAAHDGVGSLSRRPAGRQCHQVASTWRTVTVIWMPSGDIQGTQCQSSGLKTLALQNVVESGETTLNGAPTSNFSLPMADRAGLKACSLGGAVRLGDRLMDVGVQLREHRDQLLLMSGFIIAQPLHERAYIGIIGDAGCLTVAFIELALHR
jgi:hypothetical protein